MFVFDAPAVVQTSEADDRAGVIEIVGSRPDQVQKIDRRTYRVKDNPHSAQADSIQLLRGLPAVTVTPEDQILLLGSGNVAIWVDGRPIQGHATQFLRTLHGSDIERIEVITNPSAEFSPAGTGGIINFVLRRKQSDGLSGSASGEASSLGRVESSATIKGKRGKWAVELQGQLAVGQNSRQSFHKLRFVEQEPGDDPTINTVDGRVTSRQTTFGFASPKLTHYFDDRTSVSLLGFAGAFRDVSRTKDEFVGLTPDFESFSERQARRSSTTFRGTQLLLDHKGSKEGETLKATAALFGNPRELNINEVESDLGDFSTRRRNRLDFAYAKVDWQHPIGTNQILSLGAEWIGGKQRRKYRFENLAGDPGLGPDFSGQFDARTDSASAYVTFQQRVGTWTLLPGARMEFYHRKISSPGLPSASVNRTRLFPSLHLEHPIGKTLNLTLSYSKRIDRPDVEDLRPYPVVISIDTIGLGNPALRDQTTDAYELNLHYHRKKIDAGIIIYDRETGGLWNRSYSVNADGLNVVMPINAGHKSDRGAQIDVSTPLLRRVKLSTSVNLFHSRVPVDPLLGRSHFSSFRYTGNATLEWNGADQGNRPGDIAQLQLTYASASRDYQIRARGSYSLNLSYTHSFSRSLSLTGSVNGIGTRHFRHVLTAPLVQEEFVRRERQPVFKLKLSKTFGSSKATNSAPVSPPLPTTGG